MNLLSRSTIIVVCFLLALALGFGLLLPKYNSFRKLREQIKTKTQELEYQGQYISDLEEASQRLKEHKEALATIESSLPSSPDLPSLFAYFQKASSQNGLVLQSISPPAVSQSEAISGSPIKQIEVSLRLSGSYSSFKSFIATLARSSRLISISSIAFSAPAKDIGLLSFNITAKMHSY